MCSTRSTRPPARATSTITLGYVGVQPSSYPINTIFLWTGGSHEGVLQVALRPMRAIDLRRLRGNSCGGDSRAVSRRAILVRARRHRRPDLNFGAPTPVEVAIMGPDFAATRAFAAKVRSELAQIPALRDLQIEQALDYPASRSTSIASWRGSSASRSIRWADPSPPRPRPAGLSRRTTGPTRAPASRSRCRSKCRSRG